LDATVSISIRAPLDRKDLPGLYGRVSRLLEAAPARRLRCNVEGLPADAVALDAVARIALAARRHRVSLELTGASAELRALLVFAGLHRVIESV
jgi:hypothetical protein